jgi:cobalt-precorrin 5A hydrolase
MKLRYIAFTDRGKALGDRLASALGGEASMVNRPMSLDEWVGAHFNRGNGLVFIGAVGIAVRGIAGYVAHKSSDPAVVVIDEAGRFVIPILSGHLGGANMLANRISEVSAPSPVITTAPT